MRIAHVTATFPPYYGGTGTVCYHNALGLAQLGHEVTVFTARQAGTPVENFDPPGVAVRRLPSVFRLGNAPFLPGLLQLEGFDLVHLHHPFIFGAEMFWLASKIRRIPYVLTHHNDLIGHGSRRYLFDTYSALSAPLLFRGASKFAVVTLDHARFCRLAHLFRKRWSDVVEVPNGVDANLFKPGLDGSVVRRQSGIGADDRVLLFVGALDRAHYYRRLDLLLEAVSRTAAPDLHLLVVGDGDRMPEFRGVARGLGVEPRTHFLGSVPNGELPGIYAAADLLVLPSDKQESFGLVLIEAMACGKPVIASNLPGARTVVGDGQDGLLVEPGDVGDLADKLRLLLDDAPRRREMGARGRAKVETRYAWHRVIPQLVELYEQVLETA